MTFPTNCYQVDAYESKNQELVAENADLRALLRSMQVIFTTKLLIGHCLYDVTIIYDSLFDYTAN